MYLAKDIDFESLSREEQEKLFESMKKLVKEFVPEADEKEVNDIVSIMLKGEKDATEGEE